MKQQALFDQSQNQSGLKSGSVGFLISRDEMNLAEFPLTVLSTRVNPHVKTLEFSDTQRLKNGEVIERKWIITGADKFGLPTSTDDDVLLGLMRLTMDQGFRERKVFFTRYELMKTLRWTTEGRSYSRLTKSLDRLSGVRVKAANSFYDNSLKNYQTCNFGIIDAYEINDERAKKGLSESGQSTSFFIWSEVLFDSFKAGFIKKLDLELYFSLTSAVSRRLYRYLDKHFYFKSVLEKPLLTLAFEKLGLSRTYQYVSSIKQQIEPACEELVRVGFLERFSFEGRGENTVVRFVANKISTEANSFGMPVGVSNGARSYNGRADGINVQEIAIVKQLVERGLSEQQLNRLVVGKSNGELEQIEAIIKYYDFLIKNNDQKISRNPIGFLYRAVESPFKFKLPNGFGVGPKNQLGNQSGNESSNMDSKRKRPELKLYSSATKSSDEKKKLEVTYNNYVEQKLRDKSKNIPAEEINNTYRAVEQKMTCLRSVLNDEHFKKAVDGCVRDELVKLCGIEDFNAWQKNNSDLV